MRSRVARGAPPAGPAAGSRAAAVGGELGDPATSEPPAASTSASITAKAPASPRGKISAGTGVMRRRTRSTREPPAAAMERAGIGLRSRSMPSRAVA